MRCVNLQGTHKVLKKVLRYRFKNRNFATLKHSYQIDEKYILFFIALSVTFTTVAKEESLAKLIPLLQPY